MKQPDKEPLTLTESLFIFLQKLTPQHALSHLMGKLADSKTPWVKNTFIKIFCNFYDINFSEAERQTPEAYQSFNDFFTRRLQREARSIDQDPNSIVSPCDGILLTQGTANQNSEFQVKGQRYLLIDLLGKQKSLAEKFSGAHYSIIYLAPHHYHRVHMPLAGTLLSMTHIPGALFSVNDSTVRGVKNVFGINERVVCEFEHPQGDFCVILVGAMIVGSIETPWAGTVVPSHKKIHRELYHDTPTKPINLTKGEEMGTFKLGSTAIILSKNPSLSWNLDAKSGQELKLGEVIGQTNPAET